MSERSEQRSLILYGVAMSLCGIVLLYAVYLLRAALLTIYVSVLLAIGLSPAVRWIEHRHLFGKKHLGLPRWAAILVLYLIFVVAVVALLALIVPALISQGSQLWQQLPAYQVQLQDWLGKHGMNATWTEIMKSLPSPGSAVSSALGVLSDVAGALGSIVTILLLPYYLLVEASSLEHTWLHLVSKEHRPQFARMTQNVTVKVGRWLGGQMLLCLTIGCTASIGLWFIGVPFFYVLGLIAGLGELIPIIGPLIAAIPAILIALTVSPRAAILVVVYFSVQQFIEGSVLVPRIMERQVGVTAVTVIVALLIGSELFGVVGALLAVPTAAIVQVVLQEFVSREHAQAAH